MNQTPVGMKRIGKDWFLCIGATTVGPMTMQQAQQAYADEMKARLPEPVQRRQTWRRK
jgi:hypothetical protein